MLAIDRHLLFKGPKPALCRWFSWYDCHQHWRKVSSLRFLVFLLWGMGVGVLTHSSKATSLSLSSVPTEAEGDRKETMREATAKAAKIKAKGRNLLHISLLILQNDSLHRRADIVATALASMRQAHTDQVLECKTPFG